MLLYLYLRNEHVWISSVYFNFVIEGAMNFYTKYESTINLYSIYNLYNLYNKWNNIHIILLAVFLNSLNKQDIQNYAIYTNQCNITISFFK